MLTFRCPHCASEIAYDPARRPWYCTRCGKALPARVETSARLPEKKSASHQPLLDELLSHWQGRRIPQPHLESITSRQARTLFEDYQHALGRDPANWLDEVRGSRTDVGARYTPAYQPGRREQRAFIDAYLFLKQGKRALAGERFRALTKQFPRFADPWIWLTATTDDPDERLDCLETAVLLEPSHPLARDALVIALGRVSPASELGRNSQPKIAVIKCPRCAGTLRYEPGTAEVECQFCGHRFALEETDLVEQRARLMGDLRLKRRFQGQTWREVERIVRCQACGAQLVMTRYLARRCAFCGSTNVLVEDNRQALIQPDGFLPFKIGEEQAATAIRQALPAAWQRHDRPDRARLQGIYLPFWVFDGFVEARRQLTTFESVTTLSRAREPIRELLMFDNLLFCALDQPFARLLMGLRPYELDKLAPYDPHLLADWAAALYRRDVEEVVEKAYEAMLEAAARRTRPSPFERLKGWKVRRWYQITTVTYQLVLLPVWVALLRLENGRKLALVNGQTGKVVLGSPGFDNGG